MRKKFLFVIGLLSCCFCFFFASCFGSGNILQNGDKNIVSIAVDESTNPSEIVVGKFDEAGISLIVEYSDGSTDSIQMTSALIPEEYKHCLQEAGVYTIQILYRNAVTEIELNIVAYEVKYYAKNTDNETVLISLQKVNSLEELVLPDISTEIYTNDKKYTFTNWDEYEVGKTSADIIIKAEYAETNLYTVNFYNGNDSLISTQIIEEGENAIEPSEIERFVEGYEFLGWDRSYLSVSKNLNIYGVYYKIESGQVDFEIYTDTNEAGYSYQYVLFGKYPQTVVSDSALINELVNSEDVDGDGYVEYLNEEYIAVTAIENTSNSTTSFRDDTEMVEGETYYFKVEPIKWRVYDLGDGEYELISEYILDEQQINLQHKENSGYYFSAMRQYLNGDFYNKAFSSAEKDLILQTLIDNTTASGNCIDNENSIDCVYLLSYNDIISDKYGFDEEDTRIALNTDYTMALGVYTNGYYNNSGDWWLRTIEWEGYDLDSYSCVFSDNRLSSHDENGQADTNTYGIRPVIRVKVNSN